MDAKLKQDVRRCFERAQQAISSGDVNYICLGINLGPASGQYYAKGIVMQRISPHATLQDWVLSNVIPENERENFTYYPWRYEAHIGDLLPWAKEAMREYRLRWLKELIAEFS